MLVVGDRTLGEISQAEAKGFRAGGFRFSVSRVTGESHQRKHAVCDDCWAVASSDHVTVAVLSDGAGSAPLGQEGAQAITTHLAEQLVSERYQHLLTRLAESPLDAFRDALMRDIGALREQLILRHPDKLPSVALKQYSATLIGLVVAGDLTLCFHIGDSVGAAVDHDGGGPAIGQPVVTSYFAGPENGTYANETFFFTQDAWADHFRVDRVGKGRTFVLMTDGVTSFGCTTGYTDLDPGFWGPVLRYFADKTEVETAQALTANLQSAAITDLSDDDKTIILMQRA